MTEIDISVVNESVDNALNKLGLLEEEISKKKNILKEELKSIADDVQKISNSDYDKEKITDFLNEPYCVIPKRNQEWYVIAPRFINFQLGWLERSTDSYNVFVVNKYMHWISNIPKDIENKFRFKETIPLKVFDGMLLTGEHHQAESWERYHNHLSRREGKDKIRIKAGHEFKLLADLIDDGILPFIPQPVEEEDMREPEGSTIELREYQKEAWEKFKQLGAIGVYWAFSAGKTFLGLYAIQRLKGKKLVVVPTRTLKEQWESRIREYKIERPYSYEIDVVTYHSFNKLQKNKFEYTLIIFDEVQHLPANTFSRFATIKAKYRIGLSATPYREDGRTNYIFALSGFPVGLDWKTLLDLKVIEEPDISLYILQNQNTKIEKLKELLSIPTDGKTIVFCDSINLGKQLSKQLALPFVYGASSKRLETIKEANVCILSRVGDEGLSLKEIDRVIEIDFHFGSRRQEGQRMGRLFHGEGKGQHIILMTESEYNNYDKRLYAIYEKGFKVKIIR